MNENAKKWVEALRSGEYKQATKALRRGNGYCCLGVACDLYAKETGIGWEQDFTLGYLFLGGNLVLPERVKNWLGLTNNQGAWGYNSSLTEANDGGATFNEIADIIESEPGTMFA